MYLFRVISFPLPVALLAPLMMNSVASLSDFSRAWWGFSIQAMICVHGATISLAGRSKGSSQSDSELEEKVGKITVCARPQAEL
jgi:hypothetical protein